MDFGLAKFQMTNVMDEMQTQLGAAVGTVGYMSPEALLGNEVGPRSDLFAVGVMLVEALTGARPFRGRTIGEVIAAVLSSTYHLPGETPEMRALDAIVQRCLARDPETRYSSAAELSRELVPALNSQGNI
jgi:serine/threonine protein kinase